MRMRRHLNIVSQSHQTLVVDMPRHIENWSDAVILGSSDVYIITDFTVPGLKAARRMVNDITGMFGELVKPKVVVNKFSRTLFGTGISASEVKELLGDVLAGQISADERLVPFYRKLKELGLPLVTHTGTERSFTRADNALTLRTSIIGRELFRFRSLLEWFLAQEGKTIQGWTSMLVSMWFIGGIITTGVGITGVYIGKIYTEVKRRPRYFIEERV